MDDIVKEKKKTVKTKWRILKEEAEEEIKEMINMGMPIEKQMDLIIKNGILDKLERKEYTNIIKKHFGYVSTYKREDKTVQKKVVKNTLKADIKSVKKIDKKEVVTLKKNEVKPKHKKETVEDKLSKDFNLMDMHLKKKSEEVD